MRWEYLNVCHSILHSLCGHFGSLRLRDKTLVSNSQYHSQLQPSTLHTLATMPCCSIAAGETHDGLGQLSVSWKLFRLSPLLRDQSDQTPAGHRLATWLSHRSTQRDLCRMFHPIISSIFFLPAFQARQSSIVCIGCLGSLVLPWADFST